MAMVVSGKAWVSLASAAALASVVLSSSPALAERGARSTTEAQAEEKKEQAGVRVLGTGGLEDEKDPTLRAVKNERRSSLVIGLLVGGALGSAAGFPNDPTKIGLSQYYTDTGLGGGYGARAFVGVALRDFLTLGLTFGTQGLDAGENVFYAGMAGFHVELYPAYVAGGALRDLGLMFDFGAGTGFVWPKADTDKLLVDGGLGSAISAGAFYEGLRFGKKLAMGPFFGYDYYYGSSLRGGTFVLGWRTAIYPLHK